MTSHGKDVSALQSRIVDAIGSAVNEPYRQRGLFVPLSDAAPYLGDEEFLASLVFAMRRLIGSDDRLNSDRIISVVALSAVVLSCAFTPHDEAFTPNWRDGGRSVKGLSSLVLTLVKQGAIRISFSQVDFSPKLVAVHSVLQFPLTALEAAQNGIEARQCKECGCWMMHRRAGAQYCRSKCAGRRRARALREKKAVLPEAS